MRVLQCAGNEIGNAGAAAVGGLLRNNSTLIVVNLDGETQTADSSALL